jgi:N-acylneuraminate cytidylyltransferase
MVKTVAIITARGGSKRIPGKNIKEFCGKPIIAYSIQAALDSQLFDAVMVSTDDEKIADVARSLGAEVPFMRSEKTFNDFATTEDALKEVIENYHNKQGEEFELACNIYPTAPFITAKRLKEAYEIILAGECNAVFPVVQFSFPPQRGLSEAGGYLQPTSPDDYMKRSQDLQPIYHDCGQFYFFWVDNFMKTGSVVDKAKPLIISEMEVQDIDALTDWKLAEMKYKLFLQTE